MEVDSEKVARLTGEAIAAFGSAALLIGIVVVIYLVLPSNTLAFALGIPAGALSGFLVTLGTYFLQRPDFSLRVAEDKFNPQFGPWFFTHVLVKNDARGFLGGGVAMDCTAVLSVGGKDFTPKWASRPEPLSWHMVPAGPGTVTPMTWIDWSRMGEAKYEVIGPGEERPLDIVVKVTGDKNAYIHEPENYAVPQHKRNPGTGGILPPGVHVLTLVLKYRIGASKQYEIQVENLDSTAADSVKISALP